LCAVSCDPGCCARVKKRAVLRQEGLGIEKTQMAFIFISGHRNWVRILEGSSAFLSLTVLLYSDPQIKVFTQHMEAARWGRKAGSVATLSQISCLNSRKLPSVFEF
jgi:hypothetical protein